MFLFVEGSVVILDFLTDRANSHLSTDLITPSFPFSPINFIRMKTMFPFCAAITQNCFLIFLLILQFLQQQQYIQKYKRKEMDSNTHLLCLDELKTLIRIGIESMPIDNDTNQAVLVIGDTGVGKSTIMACLSGQELIVKYNGMKATIDNSVQSQIKIGHNKYSETSIPTKVVIDNMAFYDCPGFKDNKGEEFEISNSFFVQRLLDIYEKVKIILIIDQSHVSQARADKFPKLLKNLHKSFRSFEQFKDGTCLVINRASIQNNEDDYKEEILNMIKLSNENGNLFDDEQQKFIEYLVRENRILLFKQANKWNQNSKFQTDGYEKKILSCVKGMDYVKTHHIENIISESAKLAISDFIDEISQRSNIKVESICSTILMIYSTRVQFLGRDIDKIIELKQKVMKLSEEIRKAQKTNIISILQRELPRDKIISFQEDFASVLFFKEIYDRTESYHQCLINRIDSELSVLLKEMDNTIVHFQKQQQEERQRQRLRIEKEMREEQERQQRIKRQIEQEQRRIKEEEQRRRQEAERKQRERRQKQQAERLERIRQEQQRRRKREEEERRYEEEKQRRQQEWRQKQQREKQEKQRQQQLKREQKQREHRQRIQKQQREWEEKLEKQRIQKQQMIQQERKWRAEEERRYLEEIQRNIALQKEKERHQKQKQEPQANQYNERLFSSAHQINHHPYQQHGARNGSYHRHELNQNQDAKSYYTIESPSRENRYTKEVSQKPSLIEQIQSAMASLRSIEGELKKVKVDAVNLHNLNKEIGCEFTRIEQKYFGSRYKI